MQNIFSHLPDVDLFGGLPDLPGNGLETRSAVMDGPGPGTESNPLPTGALVPSGASDTDGAQYSEPKDQLKSGSSLSSRLSQIARAHLQSAPPDGKHVGVSAAQAVFQALDDELGIRKSRPVEALFGPTEAERAAGIGSLGSRIDQQGFIDAFYTPSERDREWIQSLKVGQQDSIPGQLAAALYNPTVETAGNLAMAPGTWLTAPVGGRLLAAKFFFDAAKSLPESIVRTADVLKDPRSTVQQKGEAIVQNILDAVLLKSAAHGLMEPKAGSEPTERPATTDPSATPSPSGPTVEPTPRQKALDETLDKAIREANSRSDPDGLPGQPLLLSNTDEPTAESDRSHSGSAEPILLPDEPHPDQRVRIEFSTPDGKPRALELIGPDVTEEAVRAEVAQRHPDGRITRVEAGPLDPPASKASRVVDQETEPLTETKSRSEEPERDSNIRIPEVEFQPEKSDETTYSLGDEVSDSGPAGMASEEIQDVVNRLAPEANVHVSDEAPPVSNGRYVEAAWSPKQIILYAKALLSRAAVRRALIHELGHGAARSEAGAALIERLTGTLSDEEIDAVRERGYSEEEAPEEAIMKRLEKLDAEPPESPLRRAWSDFVDWATRYARKKGWLRLQESDLRDLLRAAMKYGRTKNLDDSPRTTAEAAPTYEYSIARPKFSQVARGLPEEPLRSALFQIQGKPEQWVPLIGQVFRSFPKSVVASDGSQILLRNAEAGSWERRLQHLITLEDRRSLALDKAQWLPIIPETLKNAQVRMVDPLNGNRIYARKYSGNKIHLVVVEPEGGVVGKKPFAGKLITHFLWNPLGRQSGFEVE